MALIASGLDYCNSVLAGLPMSTLEPLQRAQNAAAASLCLELGSCIEQVADWMDMNRLQLNAAKTEFMWFVPSRRRYHAASVG